MTFTFHRGRHRARPLYWLKWWPILWNPSTIVRKVKFPFDAKYNLNGPDQEDHNKLFGVAFGPVHKKSARFGWRYSVGRGKFILSAYLHDGSERIMVDLCECLPNKSYTCTLGIGDQYSFEIKDDNWIYASITFKKNYKHKLGFLLGPYFGGNQKAPGKLQIELSCL